MENGSGFDCEFVETPPKSIQSECPVCLLVLREPYQATCCGYSFCEVCINRIKDASRPCPCCKKTEYTIFPNKGLQRSLNDYKIHCTQKKKGCEWVGELLGLDMHLNRDPQSNDQLKGCGYIEIKCLYCPKHFQRSAIESHQSELCPERPSTCQHCKTFQSSFESLKIQHWPVCGAYPIPCPNSCGRTIRREELSKHRRFCTLEVVDCDFKHVGCMEKLTRKDKFAHLENNVASHLLLQTSSYKSLIEEHKLLQQQVAELSKIVMSITRTQQDSHAISPCISLPLPRRTFTMENFSLHKSNGDTWYSEPFFSHLNGYKFCLRVRACGEGKGKDTHASVYINLMQGEFDDALKWPFTGEITIGLVNKESGERRTHTVKFCEDTAMQGTAYRVTGRDRASKGRGSKTFITHEQLKAKFLKNDSACFEITNVIVK